jgi:RNA-directed DNA polymerase
LTATVHVGQRWIFGVDIADFFPSIGYRRVKGLFEAYPFGYPEPVARLLAEICCFGDSLPQGAPTSPIISNYICRAMDRDLARLAMTHRCYYSRYADDLVFSTDRSVFPTALLANESGLAVRASRRSSVVQDSALTSARLACRFAFNASG